MDSSDRTGSPPRGAPPGPSPFAFITEKQAHSICESFGREQVRTGVNNLAALAFDGKYPALGGMLADAVAAPSERPRDDRPTLCRRR
jgi:hypothetical protein